jgi:hypothetical protein
MAQINNQLTQYRLARTDLETLRQQSSKKKAECMYWERYCEQNVNEHIDIVRNEIIKTKKQIRDLLAPLQNPLPQQTDQDLLNLIQVMEVRAQLLQKNVNALEDTKAKLIARAAQFNTANQQLCTNARQACEAQEMFDAREKIYNELIQRYTKVIQNIEKINQGQRG